MPLRRATAARSSEEGELLYARGARRDRVNNYKTASIMLAKHGGVILVSCFTTSHRPANLAVTVKYSSYGQVQQRPAAEINDENVYENRLVRYHQLSQGPCHNLSVGSIQVNGHVTRRIMSY